MSTAGQQGQGQQAGQQGATGQVPAPGQQQAAPPQNGPQTGQVPAGQQGTGQVPTPHGTGQVPAPQNVPQPGSSPTQGGQVDLSTLDPAVQKYITDLRTENASARTTAKDQAAQEAQQALAQKIGQALGLVPPGQAADPVVLQQQVEQHQQALLRQQVENLAYRRAGGLGANPDALLDSRGFLDAAHRLDQTAADFATQLDAAITASITANPLLKSAGQVPPPPQFAPNPGQQAGNGAPPQQSSVAAGRALYAQKNAKQT